MSLEFGLLITLIGVISVFSVLGVVALASVALKRLFKGKMVREDKENVSRKAEPSEAKQSVAVTFRMKLNGEEHDVKIEDLGNVGKELEKIELPSQVGEELKVVVGDVEYKVEVEKIGKAGEAHSLIVENYGLSVRETVKEAKGVITAPMQGTVVKVLIKVGDRIRKGSVVVVLETMKMENAIESAVSGVVKEIKVSEGDSVKDGDALVIIN